MPPHVPSCHWRPSSLSVGQLSFTGTSTPTQGPVSPSISPMYRAYARNRARLDAMMHGMPMSRVAPRGASASMARSVTTDDSLIVSFDALRFSAGSAFPASGGTGGKSDLDFVALIVPPVVARGLAPIFVGVSEAMLFLSTARFGCVLRAAVDGVETLERIDVCDGDFSLSAAALALVDRVEAADAVDAALALRAAPRGGARPPGDRALAALAVLAAEAFLARGLSSGDVGAVTCVPNVVVISDAVLNSVLPALAVDMVDSGLVVSDGGGLRVDGPARVVRTVEVDDLTEVKDAALLLTEEDAAVGALETLRGGSLLTKELVDAAGVSLESGRGPGGGTMLVRPPLTLRLVGVVLTVARLLVDMVLRAMECTEGVPRVPVGLSAPLRAPGMGLAMFRDATLRGIERMLSPSKSPRVVGRADLGEPLTSRSGLSRSSTGMSISSLISLTAQLSSESNPPFSRTANQRFRSHRKMCSRSWSTWTRMWDVGLTTVSPWSLTLSNIDDTRVSRRVVSPGKRLWTRNDTPDKARPH
jgi:hypothetical protein